MAEQLGWTDGTVARLLILIPLLLYLAIAVARRPALQLAFDRPTPVWLDGEAVGEGRNLSLRVEPDALICVV